MDQEICDMIKYKIIFINTILMPCFRFIKKADVAKYIILFDILTLSL